MSRETDSNTPRPHASDKRSTTSRKSKKKPASTPPEDPILKAIRACEAGQFEEGVPVLEEVVRQLPNHIPALLALGAANGQQGDLARARSYFERVIEIDAKSAIAHTNLGNVCRYSGDIAAAARAYRHAIELQPAEADAHYNLANILVELGELKEAEQSLRRTLLFRPQYAEAYNNLGDLMVRQGRIEEALKLFRQALVWKPTLLQAQNNLILSLYRLGMYSEADSYAKQMLKERPNDRRILSSQALGLMSQGRFDEAADIYRSLTVLDPNFPEPWINLGGVLQAQRQFDEALRAFEHALTLKGVDQSVVLSGMACVMLASDQPHKAAEHLKRATLLESRHAAVIVNLSTALIASGEIALGIENMKRAVTLAPKSPEMRSALLYALHFDVGLSADDRFKEAQLWDIKFGSPDDVLPAIEKRKLGEKDKLRIGFVSPDLRTHSVASCLEPLLKHIDRKRFEVTCYATSGSTDATTERLMSYVDNWRRVAPLTHIDLANRIRADGIDVLFDLSWHTGGNRLAMFALKPAPLQITWIGFSASTGLSAMNARMTDAIMDPEGQSEALNSEKLLRLPVAFPFMPPTEACKIAPLPAKRKEHITFGAISRINRANVAVLDAWAEVLIANPTAHLIVMSGISEKDEASLQRIRRLMILREIEPERIDVRPKVPLAEFLATLTEEIDVVLDTFPYCGGVTTIQALWMGVPTITYAGKSAFERTGASIMHCAGLGHLVANNKKEYVEIATRTAADIEGLTKIRKQIRKQLSHTPIIDGAAFAKAFEEVLLAEWEHADSAVEEDTATP